MVTITEQNTYVQLKTFKENRLYAFIVYSLGFSYDNTIYLVHGNKVSEAAKDAVESVYCFKLSDDLESGLKPGRSFHYIYLNEKVKEIDIQINVNLRDK